MTDWWDDADMAEQAPRSVSYDMPLYGDAPSVKLPAALAVSGMAALGFSALIVVYAKRRDWIRLLVSAALCGGCAYGFVWAIRN